MDYKTAADIHQNRQKLWDCSIANHQKYICSSTGLIYEKFIEKRKCPVCRNEDYIFMFNKEGGTYVKCPTCTMVYINPVIKDAFLNEYYSNNHDVQSEIVDEDLEFYRGLYSKGLDLINKSDLSGTYLLDFGCSSGNFLDIAKEKGFDTFGVELNISEAEVAVNKGHTVYNNDLFKLKIDNKFDVITLWDVFEHLKDGKKFLNEFKKFLKPKGIIFLQIPSSDSFAAKIMHSECNMFDGFEHVNLYSYKAIRELCFRANLIIEEFDTVISESKVIANYLSYENPYTGTITNEELFPQINDEYILSNSLGYKMQIVLRNKD